MHDCELIIILYLVHELILYLLSTVCFHLNYCSGYVICWYTSNSYFIVVNWLLYYFTRSGYFLWFSNDYFLHPVHFLNSLFALIFILFLFIFSFRLLFCRGYIIGGFTRSDIEWLLSYQFIARFYSNWDLYDVCFHLNYCWRYVCGFFYKKLFLYMIQK